MLWGILAGVVALIVLDLLVRGIALLSILPILERSPPFAVEPTAPSAAAEPVSFRTTDGLTLRGSLHPPKQGKPLGLVVFCPELWGDHWSATWYCHGLLEAGFAVLAFDFRNHGQSDSLPGYAPLHWLTEFEVNDALAAIAFARQRPDLRDLPMGVFGISRGGLAAIVAAARCEHMRAAACEGIFSITTMSLHYALRWASLYHPPWLLRLFPIWHFRGTLALARWISQLRRRCRYTVLEEWLPRLAGRPVLMIVDGNDTYVLPEVTETLFHLFPQQSSQRWIVNGAKHNMAREVQPEEFDRRLADFFLRMVPHSKPISPPTENRRDSLGQPFDSRLSS